MSEITGLDQLRAMIAGGANLPIGRTLGFSLVEVEKGHAVFEGTPDEKSYNPLGTVHGGYAATLLDSACGVAIHSMLGANQTYTTVDLNVSYHRAMTAQTGLVRAVGSALSIGRRAAFSEAKLTDASGRLLASATATLMVMTA